MPSATTTPDAVESARVDAEMLHIGYGRLPLALSLSVLVVAIFVGMLWSFFPEQLMVTWGIVLLGVAAGRIAALLAYRRAGVVSRGHRRWKTLFAVGAAAAGISWSFGPAQLFALAGSQHWYLLALTLVAVTAVSMSVLTAQLWARWSFQVAALLPAAAVLAWVGGPTDRLAASVIFAALVALMIVGRGSNAILRSRVQAELRLIAALQDASAARLRAEEASQAKSRFLANMSHELRSPLNAVIGAAQLMGAEDQDAGQRAHLVGAIQRSGHNLLGLIESILEISRIEAGELQLRRQEFNLLDCVEAALATAGVAARAKRLQLACVVDPDLSVWRVGDEARLRQVLLNLLGNAVKFTAKGEVVLRVRAGSGAGRVLLSVADTGIGIEAAALQHVFEAFRQADEGSARRFGGSGLGLAIVRQVVQAMGGQIDVQSEPGRGSCFTVELPLPPQQPAPSEPVPLALRVAYVEPHESGAEGLRALLQRLGCQATRCSNATELNAWLGADTNAADGWLLADVDAALTAPWLAQAAERLDPQRFVGLSGIECDDEDLACKQRRLPRQLVKPVVRSTLLGRLSHDKGLVGAAATDGAALPAPAVPLRSMPESQLQAVPHLLVVEDDELNRSIVCRLLKHAGYRVKDVGSGSEAIEILREQAMDLVLMDWQMPDMDGVEVTRRLRQGEAGEAARRLPIVALTANAFAEDREHCLAAGMNDFLTKPVNVCRLVATVERWVRRGGLAAAERPRVGNASGTTVPAVAVAASPTPPPPGEVFDPSMLAALPMVADGSDPAYGKRLLALFMRSLPATLESIRAALTAGDNIGLQRLLHTLKSSSAAMGARTLSEIAGQAETALRQGAAVAPDLTLQLQQAIDALTAVLASHAPADAALSEVAP